MQPMSGSLVSFLTQQWCQSKIIQTVSWATFCYRNTVVMHTTGLPFLPLSHSLSLTLSRWSGRRCRQLQIMTHLMLFILINLLLSRPRLSGCSFDNFLRTPSSKLLFLSSWIICWPFTPGKHPCTALHCMLPSVPAASLHWGTSYLPLLLSWFQYLENRNMIWKHISFWRLYLN